MNSNELKNIIENARIAKGIFQRELAKLSRISWSTLNNIINGKIKKYYFIIINLKEYL